MCFCCQESVGTLTCLTKSAFYLCTLVSPLLELFLYFVYLYKLIVILFILLLLVVVTVVIIVVAAEVVIIIVVLQQELQCNYYYYYYYLYIKYL
jgi:hypothetical protein